MKEPIIINDSGSLDIFETLEEAELYVEPIDVKNNEFAYYDSEGRVLQVSVFLDADGLERTKITDNEITQFDKAELKKLLIDFLGYLRFSKVELEKMELNNLVKESLKFKTQ